MFCQRAFNIWLSTCDASLSDLTYRSVSEKYCVFSRVILNLQKLKYLDVDDTPFQKHILPVRYHPDLEYYREEIRRKHTYKAWYWYVGKSPVTPGDNWNKNQYLVNVDIDIRELEKEAKEHKLTHLVLSSGRIPPNLHLLLPDLTHLSLVSVSSFDWPLLERYFLLTCSPSVVHRHPTSTCTACSQLCYCIWVAILQAMRRNCCSKLELM